MTVGLLAAALVVGLMGIYLMRPIDGEALRFVRSKNAQKYFFLTMLSLTVLGAVGLFNIVISWLRH